MKQCSEKDPLPLVGFDPGPNLQGILLFIFIYLFYVCSFCHEPLALPRTHTREACGSTTGGTPHCGTSSLSLPLVLGIVWIFQFMSNEG
jgi:hypothetical protein